MAIVVPSKLVENIKVWLRKKGLLSNNYPLCKTDNGKRVIIPVKHKFSIDGNNNLRFVNIKIPSRPQKKGIRLPFDLIGDVCIFKNGAKGIKYTTETKKVVELYSFVRTIYLKRGGVEGVERVPQLKLIYGKDEPVTLHKENGLKFFVNVKNAYFNPRLSSERSRLANLVTKGERVLDMFAGVGPFSITIAKLAGAHVDALDINKYAFELLRRNIQINKVDAFVKAYNVDALVFSSSTRYDRIIMNLPFDSLKYVSKALDNCKKKAVIHLYLAESSNNRALSEDVKTEFNRYCKNYTIEKQSRVLEYSPHKSILRFDVKLI